MRYLLLAECVVALITYGQCVGVLFGTSTITARIIHAGFFAVLTYGVAAQVKALDQHISFDGYAYLGLFAYTLLNIGFGRFLWTHRPTCEG